MNFSNVGALRDARWNRRFANQTAIGKMVGLTSIQVGKILEHFGWKERSKPVDWVLNEGIAEFKPKKVGGQVVPHYMYHIDSVLDLIRLYVSKPDLSRNERAVGPNPSILLEPQATANYVSLDELNEHFQLDSSQLQRILEELEQTNSNTAKETAPSLNLSVVAEDSTKWWHWITTRELVSNAISEIMTTEEYS